MRLYIYIYIIHKTASSKTKWISSYCKWRDTGIIKVGTYMLFTVWLSCVFSEMFVPISLLCLFSNKTLLLYLPFFPLTFFILFCRSLLFFSCVEAWCSTRPDTVYFVHILAMTTQYHDFFTSITQLLIPQVHCAFTCNLVVHWGFSFLFFLY